MPSSDIVRKCQQKLTGADTVKKGMIVILLLFFLGGIFLYQWQHSLKVTEAVSKNTTPISKKTPKTTRKLITGIRVMGIGGSIAEGHGAPNDNGYLQMTFHHFGDQYYNKAIYGANGTQLATLYKGDYHSWLNQIHPQAVAISWGLLNDVVRNTPYSKFNGYIRTEINQALAKNAIVFIITPPVTEFSYGTYGKKEILYSQEEIHFIQKMHTPHVYILDLFTQMKRYIENNHISISSLSSDPHHPNTKGYQIAANILVSDLNQLFP